MDIPALLNQISQNQYVAGVAANGAVPRIGGAQRIAYVDRDELPGTGIERIEAIAHPRLCIFGYMPKDRLPMAALILCCFTDWPKSMGVDWRDQLADNEMLAILSTGNTSMEVAQNAIFGGQGAPGGAEQGFLGLAKAGGVIEASMRADLVKHQRDSVVAHVPTARRSAKLWTSLGFQQTEKRNDHVFRVLK